MKTKNLLAMLLLSLITGFAQAQTTDVFKKKGYQLTFINQDATLDAAVKQKMIDAFFEVYLKLAKAYNSKTLKDVTFVVDTAYKGVAATSDGRVVFASRWMHLHPEDLDVVTHEVMHIVQDYGDTNGPGWLTEGIADYARFKFGINNEAAKWALPAYKPTHHYTNSYRITARFLHWLEVKVKPGIVKALDKQMRDHTFTDEAWKKGTGKTLDELWKAYSEHPEIV
jgi:hypothetical protein